MISIFIICFSMFSNYWFLCFYSEPTLFRIKIEKKKKSRRPWWLRGEESAYSARRHPFNPWSEKTPHAWEQLSPCTPTEPVLQSLGAATTEAQTLQRLLQNTRRDRSEEPTHHSQHERKTCVVTKTWHR